MESESMSYEERNPYQELKQLLADLSAGRIQPTPVVFQSLYADFYSCAVSDEYSEFCTYSFERLRNMALDKKTNGNFEGLKHDRVVAQYALNTDITSDELKSILSVGAYCQERLAKESTHEMEKGYLDPIAAQFAVSQKEHQAYIAMVPPEKKFLETIKEIGGYQPVWELTIYPGNSVCVSEFFDGPNAQQNIDRRCVELEELGIVHDKCLNNTENYDYGRWKSLPVDAQNTQNVIAVNAAALEIASWGEVDERGDRVVSGAQYDFTKDDRGVWIQTKEGETVFSPRGGFCRNVPPHAISDLLDLPQKVESLCIEIQLSKTEVDKSIGSDSVDKGIDTLIKYLPNAQQTDLGGIAENDGYTFARMNDSTAIFNGDGKPIYKDGVTTEHTTGKDRVYLSNFPVVAEKSAQTIDAARATAIPSTAEPAQSARSDSVARR